MKIVKVSCMYENQVFKNYTPKNSGIWNDFHFFINEDIRECDYWVVYEGLSTCEETICSKASTILITAEPPSVKTYNTNFVKQFAKVITCHQNMNHKNKTLTHQGYPWYINKTYDEMSQPLNLNKDKLISVICSDKSFTKGHMDRYNFVLELKKYFGDQLDIYGKGINEIPNKWDAIAPYKYHIAIENSSHMNYWTEKLSDTFLAETLPIYFGCPNIDKYFPQESYVNIDVNNIDKSIRIIESVIKSDIYKEKYQFIKKAKNLVLNEYNFFELIWHTCQNDIKNQIKENVVLKPENSLEFSNKRTFKTKFLNEIRRFKRKIL